VKPVEGADGNRVPLLRAGFRPVESYTVSFVFMHSGAPFAKKGGSISRFRKWTCRSIFCNGKCSS